MPDRRAVKPGIGQQTHIQRGHAHHGGGAWQVREHLIEIEFRQKNKRRCGGQRDIDRHEQSMRVENRQHMQQHVLVAELPKFLQRHRIGCEIAMAEHRAFGAARRPRSVKNGGEIIFRHFLIRKIRRQILRVLGQGTGFAILAQGEDRPLRKHRPRHRFFFRRTDEQRRISVVQQICQFIGGIGGIERHIDGAKPEAGEIEKYRFRAFLGLNGHAIAALDPARDQKMREAARAIESLAKADLFPRTGQQESPAGIGDRGSEQGKEILGHSGEAHLRLSVPERNKERDHAGSPTLFPVLTMMRLGKS